jgi:hypothetical protein
MLRKIAKKIMTFALTMGMIVATLGITSEVDAAEMGQAEDSALTYDLETESTYRTYARSSVLNYGTVKLSNLGNRVVNVTGSTVCHRVCTTARLYITLQRYVNGSWSNYQRWEYTANNTSALTKSFNVSVSGGYYYRLIGAYSATYGSTESGSSTTDGIWIP